MNEFIKPLTEEFADAAAELHRSNIRTGFLSSLGISFLRQLYKAIAVCPSGFGFVWQGENGEIWGFIACAENTGRLYKQVFLHRGLLVVIPLLRFIFRLSVLKRIWETLRYPAETAVNLPQAEVLSIAVSSQARGKGIGKVLMKTAMDEFVRRGIKQVRVAVWAGNEVANKFYQRCGFSLATTREHHGLPMNIYVIDPARLRETSEC